MLGMLRHLFGHSGRRLYAPSDASWSPPSMEWTTVQHFGSDDVHSLTPLLDSKSVGVGIYLDLGIQFCSLHSDLCCDSIARWYLRVRDGEVCLGWCDITARIYENVIMEL